MAIFVYVTERCVEDAKTHGLVDEINRLRERVESTQSTSYFFPFPPPYLVKKKLGGKQGRLIAEYRTVDEHGVVVFLAILIRGSHDYKEFNKVTNDRGEAPLSRLVLQETIAAELSRRTQVEPPPEKPAPSEKEYGLLYGAFAHHADYGTDILVCETTDWAEAVEQKGIANQLAHLVKPCLNALQGPPGIHFHKVRGKAGWGVWALKQEQRLLLIIPSTENTQATAAAQAEKIGKQLENADAAQVLRLSRRAYPSIILADDDLWIELEKDPVANLALSPEESEVLESARKADHPFPLFINGRAGSGKSTILQYLFADLLFNYLTRGVYRSVSPPLYLTANTELLGVAKAFVKRLLSGEASFAQDGSAIDATERDLVLEDSFREFYAYVLSTVPSDFRRIRFAKSNRVDYARFRKLWSDKFGRDPSARKAFGPDVSWHVIRSYIKGMDAETLLEPDDYETLPENQITVTFETYRTVYERVWTGWYQELLDDHGLWDDQDLVRYVLDNELIEPAYPAIFCDEAQDFTRIELELLLRLNLFSNRLVPLNDLGKVGFAFAGDQFQTLNPTGFRWDSIKAAFVEKFIFALDPSRQVARTDLNYRELQYNYRSSEKIVRFSNHVQALRAALFDMPGIKPQRPWTSDSASFPVTWFRNTDAAFWVKFRENGNFVVIVPCADGEEISYVNQDPVLREHVRFEDNVPLNVLSASRAKGREYPAVIVYGFGEAAEEEIRERVEMNRGQLPRSPEKELPLQYFINRLYVAVSRAKRRLVIVDSDKGFLKLWKYAADPEAESTMLDSIRRGKELWSEHIQGMTEGKPEDLVRDRAANPLDNAKAYEADGLSRQDYYSMRQAAQAYRMANDMPKYRECSARALEFEQRHLEAGQAFLEAGYVIPDAVRCLWTAGSLGWQQLVAAQKDHPVVIRELEFELARILSEPVKAQPTLALLNRLISRLSDPVFAESCVGNKAWDEALGALLARHLNDTGHPLGITDWQQIATQLDRLVDLGLQPPAGDVALSYYAAGRYPEALKHWDKAGNPRDSRYAKAKAFVEPYPRNIPVMGSLKLWKDIVDAYDQNKDSAVSTEQAGWITSALCQENRAEEALSVAWSAKAPEALLQVALTAQKTDSKLAETALRAGFAGLLTSKKWEPIIEYCSNKTFRPTLEWSDPDVIDWLHACRRFVITALVRTFAREGDIDSVPEALQRKWAEFLRRLFQDINADWTEDVTFEEAGAAIERAGRFNDGIAYYEALRREADTEKVRDFAKKRWLVCKNRQLQYEKGQRESGKTRNMERDLNKAMATMRVPNIQSLGVYPALGPFDLMGDAKTPTDGVEKHSTRGGASGGSAMILQKGLRTAMGLKGQESTGPESAMISPIDSVPRNASQPMLRHPTSPRPDLVKMTVEAFELLLSRAHARLNVTNSETLETAALKVVTRQLAGEGAFVEQKSADWWSARWGLRIAVVETDERVEILIATEAGVEIRLDL